LRDSRRFPQIRNRELPTHGTAFHTSPIVAITGSIDAVPNSTYEIHFFLDDACDAGGHGGGLTPYPATFVNVTTDTSGHADFTRTVQFMPVGRYLTALARGFSTTSTPSALMTPELSNCKLNGAGDKIFANGFD
jgi:hypothetical protein